MCLSLAGVLQAEVLIVPAGQGAKLTIATGEVAIVMAYQQSSGPAPYLTEIVAGGITNTLPLAFQLPDGPAALAGPIEIIFKESASHLMSYKRMQGDAIKSQIVRSGHTNTILVPEGKTLRFYSFVPRPDYEIAVNIRITKGTNTFDLTDLLPNREFSGPLEISLYTPEQTQKAAVYSYYLTEDFLVMPGTGFLQGPTGAFEITVQKSADLTNWFPVMIQNTSSDEKAFYRLKLAR